MSGTLLVADGESRRAERVAKACTARGFTTRCAPHGAAALEAALAEVPDVVVAPADLGLVPTPRLAEILRANPRTQGVRFLFVGGAEGAGRAGFDEVLPSGAEPDAVAASAEALLTRRARIDAVEREAGGRHDLQGRLEQIALADLLQLFHMNRRSGTIEVERRGPEGRDERGSVWLREGGVLQARAGRVEGEKALFRLLGWREGSFAFRPESVTAAARIETPTRALLLEGMRQLDEWERLRSSLPPADARVVFTLPAGELPTVVHPLTQEVLLLLESYDRVGDVVDHSSYPDYQVLRTLQTLAERGMVELRRAPEPGSEEEGARLFTAVQARRLRDWVRAGRPSGAPLPDAKLLVLSPEAEATRAFARLLGELPGVRIAPDVRRGAARADDLRPLGHLAVGDGPGIELLHVPADPAFAPVWPLAARGALGSLLLLGGRLDEAEARLSAAREALRARGPARLFHVLLLRKGERVAPQEVQERLSLLDDASLFLLPLESGKEATSLLRTMLARVMP